MNSVKYAPAANAPRSYPEALVSKALGPLPIINRFIDRLRLDRLFEEFVPQRPNRYRPKIPPAVGLGVLVRNVLVSRQPLYGLSEWAQHLDERLLGLPVGGVCLLNDDRVGRCLDDLFFANRAALMTEIVVRAVKAFDIALDEVHNDSTTLTFTGNYADANGTPCKGIPTHRITHGHNKDHRPDLKQLLWVLTTTADGSVPIWCSVEHGNTTDDQTHIDTWNTVKRIVGKADFLYVADSKLCTKENMAHIAGNHGRFITILTKSRAEDKWFRDWLQTNVPEWLELLRKSHPENEHKPDDIYRGYESPMRAVEGYRIVWVWSSQKEQLDRTIRQRCIQRAIEGLEDLRKRINSPRTRLRSKAQIEQAITTVLEQANATRWLVTEIREAQEFQYTQTRRGRPSADTEYTRQAKSLYDINWQSNAETLKYDSRTDGIFPLVTNDEQMTLRSILLAYKHQPYLEKRHEQLKTAYEVMPVNLKSPARIEAFLFVYFVALLVEALIERAIRQRMADEKIRWLPLYPEGRKCAAPTANRIFDLFRDVRRHRLVDAKGATRHCFYDELTEIQRAVLQLLGMSPAAYFAAGENEGARRA